MRIHACFAGGMLPRIFPKHLTRRQAGQLSTEQLAAYKKQWCWADRWRRRFEAMVLCELRRRGQLQVWKGKDNCLKYALDGPGAVGDRVVDAIAKLVHDKLYRLPAPQFRADLKTIKARAIRTLRVLMKHEEGVRVRSKAISEMSAILPDTDYFPPWYQMRALFDGGYPYSNSLSHDGDLHKELDWEDRLHPRGVREKLQEYDGSGGHWTRADRKALDAAMQEYVRLAALVLTAPVGKPPDEPERRFVESLLSIWVALGLPIINRRKESNSEKRKYAQVGAFADFVRVALKLYREAVDTRLECNKPLKLASYYLDGQIELVCKKWQKTKTFVSSTN